MTYQQPERAQAFVAGLHLDYTAEFVPHSKSRNADGEPCLNWRITLATDTHSLTCDYQQGAAHIPGWSLNGTRTVDGHNALKSTCETGRNGFKRGIMLPNPAPADVLHSLVLDSDALDFSDFEEWATYAGYDPDSRKAEAIYTACLRTALTLRQMIDMDEAREAFSDY